MQAHELREGWQLASSAPGAITGACGLDALSWRAARVPGTVAGALGSGDDPLGETGAVLDARDWWFCAAFGAEPVQSGEQVVLALDGVATVVDVYLNGEQLLHSESMFAAHRLDVTAVLRPHNELAICCRALAPLLAARRRPRARWRTKLVAEGNLRFYRTMLLGRAPGFAPGPPVIGPWRAVRLERRRALIVEEPVIRTRIEADDGIMSVALSATTLPGMPAPDCLEVALRGPAGTHAGELALVPTTDGQLHARGCLRVPDVQRWWPHTHGHPSLYEVTLSAICDGTECMLHAARVGFRELGWDPDWETAGLALSINGVEVFARGAVWTPLDLTMPQAPTGQLRRVLESVAAAGMNMVRVPGIGCYESDAFYDLCDELGILVWQDFMFANLDYPDQDPAFLEAVEREADQVLGRLAGRPSLTVLCGGSEVAQQVTMLGLAPELARGVIQTQLLPAAVARSAACVPYVPNSPWGGELPFRPASGVANYYGVGGYRRPLADARLAEVKFAAECLAFSNVPDDDALALIDAPGGLVAPHPAWKAGVPRDAGAGWDFEDVRDHYLAEVYGLDAVELRWTEPGRYLELSRAVTGEVMAAVFGEWRRRSSACGGGLVLWLTDHRPGAGWGLLDHRGEPKVAYHYLRRALAPVAVWSTDEGLNGVAAHLANDRDAPLDCSLRVALYRDFEVLVDEASVPLSLPAHSSAEHDVETLLGRFADVGWAYRFGPPSQDLIVLSAECVTPRGTTPVSQAFRFPAGIPVRREAPSALGLVASVEAMGPRAAMLQLCTRRLAYGVRIDAQGFVPADDAFSIEPGRSREVLLTQRHGANRVDPELAASVTATNLLGRVVAKVK